MDKFFDFLGIVKRSGNLIEGYSKCNEQRNRISLHLVIISPDASDGTKKKFTKHCLAKEIPCIEDFTKEELGSPIGRAEIKVLAVTDKSMAEKLLFLYQNEKGTN